MEKCIGCELCAGVCPARCIYVRGADNDPDNPTSPGERFGFVYEINYLRCIHCDLCVEACPTEAITESKLFEFSFTNRRDAVYTKDELLVGDDGRPQHLPWEDWRAGRGRGDQRLGARHRPVRRRRLRRRGRLERRARLRHRAEDPPRDDDRPIVSGGGRDDGPDRVHRRLGDGARWRVRRGRVPPPGALRAEPRADAVRGRRPLRGDGGALPRRRAGDRLRRGDRRAVPVRDHAARRRPRRGPADRPDPDPAPAGRGDGRRPHRPAHRRRRVDPRHAAAVGQHRAWRSPARRAPTGRSPTTTPTSASSPTTCSATRCSPSS